MRDILRSVRLLSVLHRADWLQHGVPISQIRSQAVRPTGLYVGGRDIRRGLMNQRDGRTDRPEYRQI